MLKSPLFQKLIVIVLLILASTLLSKLSPENSSIKSSEQNSQSAVNDTNAKASVRNYKTNNSQLPKEASETLNLILSNGPFPYEKDGTVFRNRENRLPHKPRDYLYFLLRDFAKP
jgi:ribonuclease T1